MPTWAVEPTPALAHASMGVLAERGIGERGLMTRTVSRPGIEAAKPRSLFTAAATWMLLAGLYMLFAGSFGLTEALAGATCASLGTLWARRAGQVGEAPFRWTVPMLRPIAGASASIPGQTAEVGLGLVRAIAGGTAAGSIQNRPASTIAQHSLSDWGAEARAERALGVLAASLAPQSYVLRLDPARADVAVHVFPTGRTREDPA